MWNFFRVEKEHINNQARLKAIEDLQYPWAKDYIDKEFGDDDELER